MTSFQVEDRQFRVPSYRFFKESSEFSETYKLLAQVTSSDEDCPPIKLGIVNTPGKISAVCWRFYIHREFLDMDWWIDDTHFLDHCLWNCLCQKKNGPQYVPWRLGAWGRWQKSYSTLSHTSRRSALKISSWAIDGYFCRSYNDHQRRVASNWLGRWDYYCLQAVQDSRAENCWIMFCEDNGGGGLQGGVATPIQASEKSEDHWKIKATRSRRSWFFVTCHVIVVFFRHFVIFTSSHHRSCQHGTLTLH